MKKKCKTVLFLATLIFCFFGCTNGSVADGRISLSSGWEYALSEDDASSGNFKVLDDSYLLNFMPLVENGRGFIWLKKTFELNEKLCDETLAIYLGRITLADETFLNGNFIGGEGCFPPEEFSAWNSARYYRVPKSLLKNGENVLLVKIWVDGEGSIVSNPFIGIDADAKNAADRENFWNSRLNLLFAFLMLIIAGYHFMIWIKSRAETENLTFALINLLSVFYLSVFFYSDLPFCLGNFMSFLTFQKVFSSGLPFVFPFLIALFIKTFLKEKQTRWIFYVRLAFLVLPIVLVMLSPSYLVLRSMRWIQIFLVPPLFYIIFVLVRAMAKGKSDAKILLLGFSPLVGFVLLDLLIHEVFAVYDFPYLSSSGWQVVIVVFLFIMANRFVNSKQQVEDLNKNLESKVEKRTASLKEANDKLSVMNSALEEKNVLLAEAQKKSERDMRLAVSVQKSFYSGMIPKFKDWDVAYIFQPAAGVSGDLYDFFYEGNVLEGVGLFDVSGHGIASGLVTMLAKAVIDRKFRDGRSKPFSQVFSEINSQLIAEKGDIENYLTGVLMRMEGNKVKFINAGHPAVYFRNARTGKVAPIALKGGEGSSGIIGIDGLNPEFKTINFNMQKDDCILLYTDCLNESRNVQGDDYGFERIQRAFALSPIKDSKLILEYIIKDFKKFLGGAEVKDDLTAIVLRFKGNGESVKTN